MPIIHFVCLYCDHKFNEYKYNNTEIEETKCPICSDTSLKVSKESTEKTDVFGYGDPAPNKDALYKK